MNGKRDLPIILLACILQLLLLPIAHAIPSPNPSAGGGSGPGMVLRVRLADGSMERIQLEEGKEETLTLGDILSPLGVPSGASVRIGAKTTTSTETDDSNLKALEIKHGSMITVLPSPKPKSENSGTTSRFAARKNARQKRDWDPYPDLAKDYETVVLQSKTKRSTGGMSYNDISKIQSALHTVEPQKEGPIKRLYMCQNSAERFYSNGVVSAAAGGKKKKKKAATSKPAFETRFGLLLGTVQKERVDKRPKKARTSLSSQTSDSEYCTVAKVQAIWEPPGQKAHAIQPSSSKSKDGKLYDAPMASTVLAKNPRVLKIAKYLGLTPVGWIFSYKDDRLEEENSFGTDGPQALFGMDVAIGGKLKIQAMKAKQGETANDNENDDNESDSDDLNYTGDKFVTLAMDASTGATEAFQLSDVAIQMVYEDLFDPILQPLDKKSGSKKGGKTAAIALSNPPVVPTKHPVLVDGQETTKLDSVLCLVNTAVLSHFGSYSGKNSNSSTKKTNGGLTLKAKKRLLKALDSPDANDFLEAACDFSVLVALDELLANAAPKSSKNDSENDMKVLCGLVRKWARGQKKGTRMDPKFKLKLKTYLS